MAVSQAQYLLMLAEDARDKGDELVNEIRQRGMAHAKEVSELSALIEHARDIVEREKVRFAQYLPNQNTTQASKISHHQPSAPQQGQIVRKAAE